MLPIDPSRALTAVHPLEKDPATGAALPNATMWRYHALTARQHAAAADCADMDPMLAVGDRLTIRHRAGTQQLLKLRYGLLEPENFNGPNGEPLWATTRDPLGQGGVVPTDDFIGRIPGHVAPWLVNLIDVAATVSVDDAGKSSPPPT